MRLAATCNGKMPVWNVIDRSTTFTHAAIITAVAVLVLVLGCGSFAGSVDEHDRYGFGHPATEEEIRVWNIDVAPTGEGLPPGRGTVKHGAEVFAAKCASCHGPTGTEGPKDRLVGGQGTLATANPIKTIGSYWPYATTLYDYIKRAMPFNAPQSLTADETYAVVAWLLFQNKIISEDAVMDAQSLPKVQMPNRDGFIRDPRPDVR
jgi:S-disulfanyl-L-cysteine oxidoreductase SoxD